MTTTTKATNSIKNILNNEFAAKGFIREICWTLSRSLDSKNQYSIPATISMTVSDIRTLLEDQPEATQPAGIPSLAEKKMLFVQNLEEKKALYEKALAEYKVLHTEVVGTDFKYNTAAKSDDTKRRSEGETKKQMKALLAKYA